MRANSVYGGCQDRGRQNLQGARNLPGARKSTGSEEPVLIEDERA
jgi:hypothetical protein